jgi:hypothetical protein
MVVPGGEVAADNPAADGASCRASPAAPKGPALKFASSCRLLLGAKAATPSACEPERKKAVSTGPAAEAAEGAQTADPAAVAVEPGAQAVHEASAP